MDYGFDINSSDASTEISPNNLPEISPLKQPNGKSPSGLRARISESIMDESTGFHRGPSNKRKGVMLIAFSWAAAFMDAVMVVGLGLIFLAGASVLNRSYDLGFATHFFTESGLVITLFLMLGSIYLLILRTVVGFTLGEWACSLRIGTTLDRVSSSYPLRVLLRTSLLFLTGIVVLPILSLCFGRDIAGILSGLKLNSTR